MSYYLAPSLQQLRGEINARWPDRDRKSDGWIGDAAHRATPSDHNPNSRGSVNAIDVDRDGIDPAALIAAFQAHPSAEYWIFDRQIASRSTGWARRTYTGDNPHTGHVHLSIRQTAAAEQNTTPWGIATADDEGALVETIKIAQTALKTLGYDPGEIDGKPGPKTLTAWAKFLAHTTNSFQWTRNGQKGLTLYSYAWDGTVAAGQARDAAEQARDEVRALRELVDAPGEPAPPVVVDVDALAAAMVRELIRLAAPPAPGSAS